MASFYARLRELREIYRGGHGGKVEDRDGMLIVEAKSAAGNVAFSGEEGGGRFLDLMALYTQFLNVVIREKHDDKVDYFDYLRAQVIEFDAISPKIRGSGAFANYVTALRQYLVGFAIRAHPLDRIGEHVELAEKKIREDFKARLKNIATKENGDSLLHEMGADGVKQELLQLGHKCGGRPIDRANRLLKIANQGVYKERSVNEKLVVFLLNDLLAEERSATLANIEKKMSLSYKEIEAERAADEKAAAGEDVTEDGEDGEEQMESTLYNPKDVPLGWDGKPIPYWMYKLHGLNHEFKCEICGNATYRGPRAFERHFSEVQHVQGLKCLGIGYSRAYMMVTRIQDALELNKKLRMAELEGTFNEEEEMEFEDRNGNVLNKKTYTDLMRQGLL